MESVRTIYVNLDHTLLRIDLLRERLVLAILRRPVLFLESILWLASGGSSRLKTEIARRSTLDIPNLPFNAELLAFLQEERASEMHLVLATAAPHAWAQAISDHLHIFDRVLATDPTTGDLKGKRKLALIVADAGGKPFGYAGSSAADGPIFEASQLPVIVGARRSLAGRQTEKAVVIKPTPGAAAAWLKSLRLAQWSKNLLIFLPAIAALQPGKLWLNAFLAFLSFSFVASAFYLLNDFCDVDSDRRHPEKKYRALACGALRPSQALVLASIFLLVAVTVAIPLPGRFDLILLGYGIVNTLYSVALKHVPILGLVTLAILDTSRIFAGDAACNIHFSAWLFAFVFFLALSMAVLKRHLERAQLLKVGIAVGTKRALLSKVGHTSGLISLLVLALYISSPQALAIYKHPALLYVACLFLFYWIERIWFRANRDRIPGDGIVFIITDFMSYVIALLTLAIMWAATL